MEIRRVLMWSFLAMFSIGAHAAELTTLGPGDFTDSATKITLEDTLGTGFKGQVGDALSSKGISFISGEATDASVYCDGQLDILNTKNFAFHPIEFRFVEPDTGALAVTHAFGTYVGKLVGGHEVTLTAYDINNELIGTVTTAPDSPYRSAFPVGDFLGTQSDVGIHRIVLNNNVSDSFAMGDFYATAPISECSFGTDFMFEPVEPAYAQVGPDLFGDYAVHVELEKILAGPSNEPVADKLLQNGYGVYVEKGIASNPAPHMCPGQMSFAAGAKPGMLVGNLYGASYTDEVVLRFVEPVTQEPISVSAFGSYVGSLLTAYGRYSEVTLLAYDIDDNLIGSVRSSPSSPYRTYRYPYGDFLGITSGRGIHKIVATNDPGNSGWLSNDGFALGAYFTSGGCDFGTDFMYTPKSSGGVPSGDGPELTVEPTLQIEADSANGVSLKLSDFNYSVYDTCGCGPVTVEIVSSMDVCPVGTHIVKLVATDGSGATTTKEIEVTVVDSTSPSLTVPSDVSIEGTAPNTPVDLGEAVAHDLFPVTITNDAPVGGFPVGTTVVTWWATDVNGNTTTSTQTVTITDTVAPSLTLPPLVTLEAAGLDGTPISASDIGYTANDVCDSNVTVTLSTHKCDLGGNVVVVTACDASGNCTSDTTTILVQDTAPPSLTVPADVTVEATGPSMYVDIGTANASDAFPVTITNDAPEMFDKGATVVTWTATDANGNTTTTTQTVVVQDTTPPELTVPGSLTLEATGPGGVSADISNCPHTVSDSCGCGEVSVRVVTERRLLSPR